MSMPWEKIFQISIHKYVNCKFPMKDYITNSMDLEGKMDFFINYMRALGTKCISYITMIDDIY